MVGLQNIKKLRETEWGVGVIAEGWNDELWRQLLQWLHCLETLMNEQMNLIKYAHDSFREVRLEELWLVSLNLTVLDWFVVQECIQLHGLVRCGPVFVRRAGAADPEVDIVGQGIRCRRGLVCLQ